MRTKTTKKPKRVILIFTEIKSFICSYTCPSCRIKYAGTGFRKSKIIRFRCDCGQELIIDQENLIVPKEMAMD